MLHVSEM